MGRSWWRRGDWRKPSPLFPSTSGKGLQRPDSGSITISGYTDMCSLEDSVGLLGLLADPTRVRLLALLEREELTVAELVSITDLGQSRVSTHLGKLREAGLVRVRPSGASAFHALSERM